MIRNLIISAVLNGFEIKVGCQTLVFTDIAEMLKEIRRYLKKPEEVEKEYLEKALNAKHMVPNIAPGTQYYAPPSPQAPLNIPSYYPDTTAVPYAWTTCTTSNTASLRWSR